VRAHVVDNLTLEVRNLKVPSFTHDVVLHSAELVELESTMTGLNIENRCLPHGHKGESCTYEASNGAQLLFVVHDI